MLPALVLTLATVRVRSYLLGGSCRNSVLMALEVSFKLAELFVWTKPFLLPALDLEYQFLSLFAARLNVLFLLHYFTGLS